MKIRTDFVTNSSSSSYTNIEVDNPVLLEILQRYKDMGVFGDSEDLLFEISKLKKELQTNLAFCENIEADCDSFFTDNRVGKLTDVIEGIIELLDKEEVYQEAFNQQLFVKLKAEIRNREKEILNNFIRVDWIISNVTNESLGLTKEELLEFLGVEDENKLGKSPVELREEYHYSVEEGESYKKTIEKVG